jgi:hypothetical protein
MKRPSQPETCRARGRPSFHTSSDGSHLAQQVCEHVMQPSFLPSSIGARLTHGGCRGRESHRPPVTVDAAVRAGT